MAAAGERGAPVTRLSRHQVAAASARSAPTGAAKWPRRPTERSAQKFVVLVGFWDGAGDGIRTRDINLGKVALYQLSYSRVDNHSRSKG